MFDGAFLEDEYNVLHIFRNSRFPWYNNYLRTISLTPEFEKIPFVADSESGFSILADACGRDCIYI